MRRACATAFAERIGGLDPPLFARMRWTWRGVLLACDFGHRIDSVPGRGGTHFLIPLVGCVCAVHCSGSVFLMLIEKFL